MDLFDRQCQHCYCVVNFIYLGFYQAGVSLQGGQGVIPRAGCLGGTGVGDVLLVSGGQVGGRAGDRLGASALPGGGHLDQPCLISGLLALVDIGGVSDGPCLISSLLELVIDGVPDGGRVD